MPNYSQQHIHLNTQEQSYTPKEHMEPNAMSLFLHLLLCPCILLLYFLRVLVIFTWSWITSGALTIASVEA